MARARGSEIATEVAVVGGGIGGLAMAAALGTAGIDTVVIDRLPAETSDEAPADGRTTALLGSSVDVLRTVGAWPAILPAAAPLRRLALINQRRGVIGGERVCFDAAEAGHAVFGYNVPNSDLRRALIERIASLTDVRHLQGGAVNEASFDAARASLVLDDGRRIGAALAIAADGRDSLCRRVAGIGVRSWSYGQTALVGAFRHAGEHNATSTEIHTASGPFTTVPLGEGTCSYVWVERSDDAKTFAALSDPAFLSALDQRVGFLLGRVEALEGRRMSYPLNGSVAQRFYGPRLALIAEAAHGLHPIGAQGLNLSLRDVATLAELVSEAAQDGADVGRMALLRRYEALRRPDVLGRLYATDMLSQVTGSDRQPIRLLRGLGLAAMARTPALRRMVMKAGLLPV